MGGCITILKLLGVASSESISDCLLYLLNIPKVSISRSYPFSAPFSWHCTARVLFGNPRRGILRARHSIISQIFLVLVSVLVGLIVFVLTFVLVFVFLHVIVDVVVGHVEATALIALPLVLVLGNCTALELWKKFRVVYQFIVVVVFICRGTQ